jgi:hypothetical protein
MDRLIFDRFVDKVAKFLDQINQKELAFQIVSDKDHKFDLAITLG